LKAKGGTYRRQEILESLGRDESKVHEAEVPGERILDGVPETVPGASDGLIDAAVGAKNAILSHLTLLFCQPAGVVRPVWKSPVGNKRD